MSGAWPFLPLNILCFVCIYYMFIYVYNTMYTERKTSMQYPQPFSGLSCLTGTNNLVSKNNFIKNTERGEGFRNLKIKFMIQHFIFFNFAVILGWVDR